MPYTLITSTGKIYTFYIKALAETYLQAYGGTIIDPTVCMVTQEIALL
jgi:hypothetical protein